MEEKVMKQKFTPTEQRLFDVLKDQLMHQPDELRRCLVDELGPDVNIAVHISKMRVKIRPTHEIISRRINNILYYRYVRVISPVEI